MRLHDDDMKLLIKIFGIVAIIAGLYFMRTFFIESTIKSGFYEIMDERIDSFILTNEYAIKAGLNKVDYKIVDIDKVRDDYVIRLTVELQCEKDSDDYSSIMAAHGIVFELSKDYYDLKLGDYNCTVISLKYDDYYSEELITVFVNDDMVLYPSKNGEDSSILNYEGNYECRHPECSEKAKYTYWEKQYCNKHLFDKRYCKHPGCDKEVYIYLEYCPDHD